MNLFEKIGLVERDAVDLPIAQSAASELVLDEVDVDAEITSPANIVFEIYAQNQMADKGDSIFTVQALIDTLPPEMTKAKQQATVFGILRVSGKSVEALVADAAARITILSAAREKVVAERENEISEANADIETLKQAIETAYVRIKEAEEIIGATKQSVSDEIDVINGLVEFCKGMEVSE